MFAIHVIVAARLTDWDVAIPAAEEPWSLAAELAGTESKELNASSYKVERAPETADG